MLNKLKELYGDKVVLFEDNLKKESYHWFITPENKTIGLPVTETSKEEIALLNIFLTSIKTVSLINETKEEKFWKAILFNNKKVQPNHIYSNNCTFRFIQFKLKDDLNDLESFSFALKNFFSSHTVVIWNTVKDGTIIETQPNRSDKTINFFDSIVDTIASEFYIQMIIYIGLPFHSITEAKDRYLWERSCFSNRTYMKEKIHRGQDLVPHTLLDCIDRETKIQLMEHIFNSALYDDELIKSIKVYLECNMNISLAAKKLYMHRNSLQYRIDKFIEKTGLDVKKFSSAVSIYLLLLIKDSMN